jgi:outer membrane protein assembly factor BamB
MKPIRLSGRIMVAPLVSGARVIVVTDLGGIRILEVNAANPNQPVVDAVEGVVASFKSPLVGYSVYDRGALWVGNDRFTKYDVQASRARMQPQWIKDERDTFVAPPQVIGDNIYHLRRRKESPAYTATAVQGDDGKVLWEVDLALPTALLTVDMQRKQIHSVCAQAELFEVTADVFQTGHVDQVASAAVGAARGVPFDESIPMAAGRWALASPLERHRVVLYDPNAASATGRLIAQPLKAAGDAKVTATPVCCNGGLLLPLDNGQVELVDPGTGERKILPFQPRVEAGRKVQWRRPAVVGAEGKEFVVADDQGKLYRVGVKDQPQPHLAELAAAQLEMKIDLTLAAAGDAVYAVVRGPTADTVVAFATADLAAGKEWPLEGRVVWGPESVGAWVLVATDRQGLLCFEAGQKQRWTSPLAYGPLAGRPAVQDQDLILSSLSGVVWRISGNDGKELKKIELGEPLGSGPVAFGNRLLLAGADGTLLVISAL